MALTTRVLDAADEIPSNAVSQALRAKKYQTAQLLIDRGAPVDGGALCSAAAAGALDWVETLLDHGVAVNGDEFHEWSNPLWLAARHGHTAIVEKLLEHNANAVVPVAGSTSCALHEAAHFLHTDTVKVLVRHTPIDARGPSYIAHGSALHAVCCAYTWKDGSRPPVQCNVKLAAQRKVVKLLLFHNIDCSLKDTGGRTAAELARSKGRADVADFIDCVVAREREILANGDLNDEPGADADPNGEPGARLAKRARQDAAQDSKAAAQGGG